MTHSTLCLPLRDKLHPLLFPFFAIFSEEVAVSLSFSLSPRLSSLPHSYGPYPPWDTLGSLSYGNHGNIPQIYLAGYIEGCELEWKAVSQVKVFTSSPKSFKPGSYTYILGKWATPLVHSKCFILKQPTAQAGLEQQPRQAVSPRPVGPPFRGKILYHTLSSFLHTEIYRK